MSTRLVFQWFRTIFWLWNIGNQTVRLHLKHKLSHCLFVWSSQLTRLIYQMESLLVSLQPAGLISCDLLRFLCVIFAFVSHQLKDLYRSNHCPALFSVQNSSPRVSLGGGMPVQHDHYLQLWLQVLCILHKSREFLNFLRGQFIWISRCSFLNPSFIIFHCWL